MQKLKLNTIFNKANCLGTITQDKQSGLYYTQHTNDMGFWATDLVEFGNTCVNIIKKIFITNKDFIYELESQELTGYGLVDYNTALAEFTE